MTALSERRDLLARGVGIAAVLAGCSGIVGHVLHVTALLRPFGLGIAPSLEESVSLLALGVISLLLFAGKVGRWGAAALGGLLAVFGALAAYRHLGAFLEMGAREDVLHPLDAGSAVCFALQGLALALISLRPSLRAPLAVTSTITVGLSVTSLLAYSIGVSMLRRYGAEIPFLVALALALHGGGMLTWAWYADVKESGAPMPAWSPLVAAISAGALFVGFMITVEGNAALLQVVLVLGAAGKLGSTVHQRLEERRADIAARYAANAAQRRAEVRTDEAVAQRAWLEKILDLAPVPLVMIDPGTAKVSFANEAAIALAGGQFPQKGDAGAITYVDAIGRPLAPEGTPPARVVRGERLDGVEVLALTPAGRRALIVHGALLSPLEGQPPVAVLALQDITRLRRVEEETGRLGRIVDDTPTEVYAFDAETLTFVEENAAARRNLGYRGEELACMTVEDLCPALGKEQLAGLLEPLRTGEESVVTLETTQKRKDGSLYPVEARIQLSRAEAKPVFVAMVENITVRKRTEAERLRLLARERAARGEADAAGERLAFIASASRALAEPADLVGTLRAVVRAAVPHLGRWSVLHLVGADGAVHRAGVAAGLDPDGIADVLEHEPLAREATAVTRAIERGEIVLEAELTYEELEESLGLSRKAAYGAAHRLGAAAALTIPLSGRGTSLGALTLVEATDPARWSVPAERALAEEYAGRAALAIHDAQLHEDAKSGLRARDEFLVVASHELRMPLSLLEMQVESMQRAARRATPAGVATDKLTRFLDNVLRLARQLSIVVEDMLDPSRLTDASVRLSIEPLDLAGLVCTVVARFGDQLDRAGSRVLLSATETAFGEWDRFRLEQVVSNLLSNAIEAGAGKPIEVSVESDHEVARVRVRDHGAGLTEERKAQMFSLADRAISARHYGGAGLGMFLVQRIVDALGGRIEVTTHPDGTSFTITLPRRPRRAEEVAA